MESVKVIIVGGGVAGLGAAKVLGSHVNYLIIEAQNYLGGRIFTVDAAPNVTIDLGAQFIHGQTNNPVYEICQQLDCILPETDIKRKEMLAITSDRTEVDPKIMEKAFTICDEILHQVRSKYGDPKIPTDYPFSDYFHEHLRQSLQAILPNSSSLIDELIDYFDKSELIENGCDSLTDLSLVEYGSFEPLPGLYQYQFKTGGYRSFISYMKSFIPDDNRIRLNSEVIRVKYLKESQQLLVHIRHHNNTSEEQISTILCDHMIWTSSLGYLKDNFSMIFADETELIKQKQDVIDKLGFSTINKVIMFYDKCFWPKTVNKMILLTKKNSRSIEFSETLKELLNTEKVDHETVNTIIQAIYQYDKFSSTDAPVLFCWFAGQAAVLIENLSERVIGQICHEVLCSYLNISSTSNQLTRVFKSEWHKNKFVRGSYAYYSIKSSTNDGEQLRADYVIDGIPRIQFAGEATHEKFYSTVHGALESGFRAGYKLISIMNK